MERDRLAAVRKRFEGSFTQTDGCWNWRLSVNAQGYGKFKFSLRSYRAHRFAYELYVGPIPQGIFVCHRCDNPSCVNPEHLFLGTPKQNAHDMIEKGRGVLPPRRKPGAVRGSSNPKARLNETDVLEIKSLLESKVPVSRIAEKFNATIWNIGAIRRGETWAWLKHSEIKD